MINDELTAARNALATIRALTDCPTPRTDYRCDDATADCLHTRAFAALRDIMIDSDTEPPAADDPYFLPAALFDALRDAYATLAASPYYRDDITRLALDNSLCPLHFIDYAACFDDDDPDCAAIRLIHPSHDT